MGYTHYLNGDFKGLTDEAFENVVCHMSANLVSIIEKYPELAETMPAEYNAAEAVQAIRERDAEALADFFIGENEFFVTFEDVETANIHRGDHEFFSPNFSFCKTGRLEPMDRAVAALFMTAEKYSGGRLEFSSDGDDDELAEARKLFMDVEAKNGDDDDVAPAEKTFDDYLDEVAEYMIPADYIPEKLWKEDGNAERFAAALPGRIDEIPENFRDRDVFIAAVLSAAEMGREVLADVAGDVVDIVRRDAKAEAGASPAMRA